MAEDMNNSGQKLKFRTGNFIWKVRFNIPLDPSSVNEINIFVLTSKNTILPTVARYNSETRELEVEPAVPYSKHEDYTLNISTRVRSAGGNYLRKPIKVEFVIE